MPELSVVLIIGAVSLLIFGGGIVTAARMMTGRKAKSED